MRGSKSGSIFMLFCSVDLKVDKLDIHFYTSILMVSVYRD